MDDIEVVKFKSACENAIAVQAELLLRILLKNSTCEYLQRHGAPSTLEDFLSKVPIVVYDDIWQDIQRVADGSTEPILCNEPIARFAFSSGTSSGKHKIIPQTLDYSTGWVAQKFVQLNYRSKAFPLECGRTGKPTIMNFCYSGPQHKTKSGLPVGSLSTLYYKGEGYKQELMAVNHTSPRELVITGLEWSQTTYCHLLCGLLQRHKVDYIESTFAFTICEAMRLLRTDWRELCEDIFTGTLNPKITNEAMRSVVSEVLKSKCENQKQAEELSVICSKESWDGIIPLLWPRAKYVLTVVTGAMQPYVPTLKRYAGDLPLVGTGYGSSESLLTGININPEVAPEDVVFTLVPNTVFYEFLPVDGDHSCICGIAEVEVGKLYEFVITTTQGLYRYKVGDVVRVVGFFGKTPQMAFCYRKNAVLSITAEKIDEQEIQKAVLKSFPDTIEVANFTSYADYDSRERPHYVIFCELLDMVAYSKRELLEVCCDRIDKSFDSVCYFAERADKAIGALELVMVKQGSFGKLRDLAIKNGGSPGQYKTPRCVTSAAMVQLLRENEVSSFTSLEMPESMVIDLEPKFPGAIAGTEI